MKKFMLPSMIFVVAFIVGLIFQDHTFVQQGHLSLFLLAPDYFREVFSSPFPLSYLLSQFLLQFYDIPVVGVAVTALLIAAVYCLSRSMTLSCASWIYLSLSGNVQAVVALVLFAAVVRLVLRVAKLRVGRRPAPSWAMAGAVVLIVCSAVFICLSPSVRSREIRAAVEEDARHLRQGTSLLTLMQLIRYNIENENYTLVRKYASVLSHNPRNNFRARKIMEVYGRKEDRMPDADCSGAEIVTNDPMVNLGLIHKAGISSDMAAERLAAYMYLQGENN